MKGLELHLLEGGLSKDLWASVKSITVISKFGRCCFEAVLISFFPLNVFPTDFSTYQWILPVAIITVVL